MFRFETIKTRDTGVTVRSESLCFGSIQFPMFERCFSCFFRTIKFHFFPHPGGLDCSKSLLNKHIILQRFNYNCKIQASQDCDKDLPRKSTCNVL